MFNGIFEQVRKIKEDKTPTAYPYHKRIYLNLSDEDKAAMEALVFPEIKQAAIAGKPMVSKEYKYVTKKPLELSADQCSATFDNVGKDLFMDVNWELIGEDIPAGQVLLVQGEMAYTLEKGDIEAMKKANAFADFDEYTTGTIPLDLNVDGDDVMQKFYSSPKGKAMFVEFLKEEGVKIAPQQLNVVWDKKSYHSYSVEEGKKHV